MEKVIEEQDAEFVVRVDPQMATSNRDSQIDVDLVQRMSLNYKVALWLCHHSVSIY